MPGRVRLGTVGRPVAGMEVTIADDREILPRVYGGSLAELAAGPQVLAEAASGVADDDERLARVRQVEYWYLLPMGWTVETDELATTLKLSAVWCTPVGPSSPTRSTGASDQLPGFDPGARQPKVTRRTRES